MLQGWERFLDCMVEAGRNVEPLVEIGYWLLDTGYWILDIVPAGKVGEGREMTTSVPLPP